MSADLLSDIDRFIRELAPGVSRPEAMRKLTSDALKAMGLRRQDTD